MRGSHGRKLASISQRIKEKIPVASEHGSTHCSVVCQWLRWATLVIVESIEVRNAVVRRKMEWRCRKHRPPLQRFNCQSRGTMSFLACRSALESLAEYSEDYIEHSVASSGVVSFL
jgi:hypothetical protein